MYGGTYGRLEIHPCVLQDIGPLEPLPKKKKDIEKDFDELREREESH